MRIMIRGPRMQLVRRRKLADSDFVLIGMPGPGAVHQRRRFVLFVFFQGRQRARVQLVPLARCERAVKWQQEFDESLRQAARGVETSRRRVHYLNGLGCKVQLGSCAGHSAKTPPPDWFKAWMILLSVLFQLGLRDDSRTVASCRISAVRR